MTRRRRSVKKTTVKAKSTYFLNDKPQPTNLKVTQIDASADYADAVKSKVKVESSPVETLIKALQRWGPVSSALVIVAAVILAYTSFKNDIDNSKADIAELKKTTKKNDSSIREIEKDQVAIDLNLSNLATNNQNLNDEVVKLSTNLKTVEIEQAKINHTHPKTTTITAKAKKG